MTTGNGLFLLSLTHSIFFFLNRAKKLDLSQVIINVKDIYKGMFYFFFCVSSCKFAKWGTCPVSTPCMNLIPACYSSQLANLELYKTKLEFYFVASLCIVFPDRFRTCTNQYQLITQSQRVQYETETEVKQKSLNQIDEWQSYTGQGCKEVCMLRRLKSKISKNVS